MATLFEYYNTGDDGGSEVADADWRAQTFTPSASHTITSVKLKLGKKGSPGTLTVGIRETDVDGKPTGDDLCSGTIDGDTLIEYPSYDWYEITLGDGYNLNTSTKYAIVIRATDGTPGFHTVSIKGDVSSPTYSGGTWVESSNSGSDWTIQAAYDFLFEEWGDGFPSQVVGGGSIAISGATNTIASYLRAVGSGSIAVTGALLKKLYASVGLGAVAITGGISTATAIYQAIVGNGAIAIASSLSKILIFTTTVGNASVAIAGSLTKIPTFVQLAGQGSVAIAGNLSKIVTRFQSVGSGVVAIAGSLVKVFVLRVGDGAIAISGSLTKQMYIAVGGGAVAISSSLLKRAAFAVLTVAFHARSLITKLRTR
jgi:hypothetical protein